MAKTKIEWADEVWNPVTGCSKVSQGCKNCYAETIARRFWGERKFTDVQMHPERLDQPLHWRKPRRVFVNSMSDLFHEQVPSEFIQQVFDVMRVARQNTFMILTKRPEIMIRETRIVSVAGTIRYPFPNVWLGVSVEDQAMADERIPLLLQTPAAVRFVSVEPMLGTVEITPYLADHSWDHGVPGGLSWVICGGESGPHARPMHPDWARGLRDQCQEAGVPFFFKQWGEWLPKDHYLVDEKRNAINWGCLNRSGSYFEKTSSWNGRQGDPNDDYEVTVYKVGKKAAGRVLDGKTHDEYPGVE